MVGMRHQGVIVVLIIYKKLQKQIGNTNSHILAKIT